MNIKHYCVVKEPDLDVLVARTTDLISNGWVVLGGIAVGSEQVEHGQPKKPFFCQALVLPRTQMDARRELSV